jgi:2-polyprenyl-3-methyl-5-hydroxy-6-metoxy-1,4-benzoquinol methylase
MRPGSRRKLIDREPWTHNRHYHGLLLAAVPPGCERALDVGCGLGALTRELRHRVPNVTGIDKDANCIELARRHPAARGISYIAGDFLSAPFEPSAFDLITALASLHHMDEAAALQRMGELVKPGGVVAVVGLARDSSLVDLALNVPAFLGNCRHSLSRQPETEAHEAHEIHQPPVSWPPPSTYREIRQLGARTLPGVVYRRHLYWRYSLHWTRPR